MVDDQTIFGTQGDDTIVGSEDHDTLIGEEGDDTLTGGAGHDTFIYDARDGNDTITDFTSAEDKIDFSSILGVTGFDDLTITADGDDVLIDLGGYGGGEIRLQNVDITNLDADDFIFGKLPSDVNLVKGTEGDDTLDGGEGSDIIYGGKGDDAIDGGEGRDFIYGGANNDWIEGGAGDKAAALRSARKNTQPDSTGLISMKGERHVLA